MIRFSFSLRGPPDVNHRSLATLSTVPLNAPTACVEDPKIRRSEEETKSVLARTPAWGRPRKARSGQLTFWPIHALVADRV